MKLRIQGSSLRLRISRSELTRLTQGETIESTIYFAPAIDARLTYALTHHPTLQDIAVTCQAQRVEVLLSTAAMRRWAEGDDVGIYGSVESGHGPLELIVEKDFACLDGDPQSNADTFPNPNADSAC